MVILEKTTKNKKRKKQQQQQQKHGKCVVRVGKRITWGILNEDMDDIIRIIKLLENSSVLVDGVGEIAKNETIKQEGGFLVKFSETLRAGAENWKKVW